MGKTKFKRAHSDTLQQTLTSRPDFDRFRSGRDVELDKEYQNGPLIYLFGGKEEKFLIKSFPFQDLVVGSNTELSLSLLLLLCY